MHKEDIKFNIFRSRKKNGNAGKIILTFKAISLKNDYFNKVHLKMYQIK